jgi:hypothetical protein
MDVVIILRRVPDQVAKDNSPIDWSFKKFMDD